MQLWRGGGQADIHPFEVDPRRVDTQWAGVLREPGWFRQALHQEFENGRLLAFTGEGDPVGAIEPELRQTANEIDFDNGDIVLFQRNFGCAAAAIRDGFLLCCANVLEAAVGISEQERHERRIRACASERTRRRSRVPDFGSNPDRPIQLELRLREVQRRFRKGNANFEAVPEIPPA